MATLLKQPQPGVRHGEKGCLRMLCFQNAHVSRASIRPTRRLVFKSADDVYGQADFSDYGKDTFKAVVMSLSA